MEAILKLVIAAQMLFVVALIYLGTMFVIEVNDVGLKSVVNEIWEGKKNEQAKH